MRRIAALAALLLLGAPGVEARDLFRFGDGPEFQTIWPENEDIRFKSVFGMDSAGWLYGAAVGDAIGRWDPADPDGTWMTLDASPQTLIWNADHSDMRFVLRDLGARTVAFGAGWCFDGSLTKPRKLCELLGPFEWPEGWDFNYASDWLWAPDGRYCVTVREVGFVCMTPGEGDLDMETVIDVKTLSEVVIPNPGFAIGYVLEEPPVAIWDVKTANYLRDGTLMALVRVTWAVGVPLGNILWHPYVIAREPGSQTWVPLTDIGPAPDATENATYARWGAIERFYDEPALGGAIGWPSGFDWDFSVSGAPSGIPGQGRLPAEGPVGQRGELFDFRAGRGASISLTGLELRLLREIVVLDQHPEGGLLVRAGKDVGRVTGDLDRLDIDRDSLTWAEEVALGTSDLTPNSDGSPVADNVEVALGMDPAKGGDEGSLERSALTSTWCPSPAIFWHLPDEVQETVRQWGMAGVTTGGSAEGPLCLLAPGTGYCLWLDGTRIPLPTVGSHRLLGFPSSSPHTKSADGTHVAWLDGDGLQRLFFADGLQDVFLPLDGLEPLQLGPNSGLQIHPARADLAFVSSLTTDAAQSATQLLLLAVEAGKEPRILYDHFAARCDNELGPCHPLAEQVEPSALADQHDVAYPPRPLGWNETLQAFEILVAARYMKYRIGVPLEGEPFLIESFECCGAWNNGQWNWMLRLGEDHYLTDAGEMHGTGYFLPTAFQDPSLFNNTPPLGAFGHTVFHTDAFGNLTEQVRYAGNPQPGDALIVAEGLAQGPGNYGMNLFWSRPRGGAVPLWTLNQWWGDQTRITGADINTNGVLCVADQGNGALRRFESPGGIVGYRPTQVSLRDDFGAPPLDCVMADDDSTLVLVEGDPPRLVRVPTDFWAATEDLGLVEDPAARQVELAPAAMGGFEPTTSAAGIYCNDLSCFGATELELSGSVHLGVRPNGQILVAEYGLPNRAVELRRMAGSEQKAGIPVTNTRYGLGLALIPGGEPVDPWTGLLPEADSSAGAEIPPPEPLSGGALAGDTTDPGDTSGGCSATPSSEEPPLGAALLLLLLPLIIWARGRRWILKGVKSEGR